MCSCRNHDISLVLSKPILFAMSRKRTTLQNFTETATSLIGGGCCFLQMLNGLHQRKISHCIKASIKTIFLHYQLTFYVASAAEVFFPSYVIYTSIYIYTLYMYSFSI